MAAIVANVGANNWNTNGAWIGAVQPTAADDVTIPAAATVTIPTATTAVARSVTVQALGTLAFATTTAVLTIGDATAGAGSVALSNAGTITLTGIGTINFVSTSATVQTVISGGQTLPNLTYNGAGGSWQLADNNTSSGLISLTTGTLDTNGKTCSWGSFSSNNANVRTLALGASAISCNGTWTVTTWTNLTVTANTATVTSTGTGAYTMGDVDWNGLSVVLTGGGTVQMLGNCTLANLTRTGGATLTVLFNVGGDFTITGTLTLGGNTTQGNQRLRLQPASLSGQGLGAGTSRLITVGAVVITGDVAFQSINLIYSGAPSWTNTGNAFVGDSNNNSAAIVANRTAPATQTATGTASFTWSTHGWTSRVPLPQDDVVINNAFVAGQTITADMPILGRNVDFSGSTGAPTFNHSVGVDFAGDVTLSNNMVLTGASNWRFTGLTPTLTSNGRTLSATNVIPYFLTNLTLADALSMTGNLLLTSGSVLNLNNQNCTAATFGTTFAFLSAVDMSPTINMGSGTFTLTGTGTVWNAVSTGVGAAAAWNVIVNCGTSTIDITNTSATAKTFAGSGRIYGTVKHTATGSAGLTITGNNTFTNLDLECTTARTITLPASGTQTVTGTLTLSGAAAQLLSLVSSTPGTTTTISLVASTSTATINAYVSRSADVRLNWTSLATDSVSVSDAATAIFAQGRVVSDSVSVSDSAGANSSQARTCSDSISISDTATCSLGAETRSASDSVSVSDSASRSSTSQTRTCSDSVLISDLATRTQDAQARITNDSFSVSDSANRSLTSNSRTSDDTVSVLDSAPRSNGAQSRTSADAVSISDLATRGLLALSRYANDSFTVSDALTKVFIQFSASKPHGTPGVVAKPRSGYATGAAIDRALRADG